ncbi:hypothetical protein BG011_009654 [Mortierella polycephala]|uniref:Uncharacterized protein n=1 Tax=Mortierella polycephala TaxID=41804 RepID=A0A9P6U7Q6_9FUNG|nr:hypothetical protein BG011_009654 [Mortierella polycephala]
MSGNIRGAAETSRRSHTLTSTLSKSAMPPYSSQSLSKRSTSQGRTSSSRLAAGPSISAMPENRTIRKKYGAESAMLSTDAIEQEGVHIVQQDDEGVQHQHRRHHNSHLPSLKVRHNHSPYHNHQGSSHNISNSNSNTSNSSSISKTENSNGTSADANFRAGMKLIQQAYEDKYQSLLEEVNAWKWISEEQSAQITAVAAELARVEGDYAALQTEMAQLEIFRKAIVSMVDQHSGVSLTQLEQSILETIEAENTEMGYEAAADADTSSFVLDDNPGASIERPLHQRHISGEEQLSRERKSGATSAGTSSIFKSSPNLASSRPRASTEVSVKKAGSTQRPPDSRNRSQGSRNALSPLGQTRGGAAFLSDSSQQNSKKLQKGGSTENVRNKRNTISTSSRSLYPSAPHTTSNTTKRHSSVSPHPPNTRAATSSSRLVAASTSVSTNSTSSASPRQPLVSAVGASNSGPMTARTARQYQQQKEYNLNGRSHISNLAGASGVSSHTGTSIPNHGDKRHVSSETPTGLQAKSGHTSNAETTKRSHRSGSGAISLNGLSPAAIELIRRQEIQQQLEDEKSSARKPLSSYNRHGLPLMNEDDEHRRTTGSSHARSLAATGSTWSRQRKLSESAHESPPIYESSSRHPKEGSRHRDRESASHGDKYEAQSVSVSNEHETQQSNGNVNASAFTMLYKEIRDSMDSSSFGLFAQVVAAFNEGEKSTEETLQEVGKIVKDRELNQRFRDLIHQAIAEKQDQMENDTGNVTFEGDKTLEIDQSLLLDDGEEGLRQVSPRSQDIIHGHGDHSRMLSGETKLREERSLGDIDAGHDQMDAMGQVPVALVADTVHQLNEEEMANEESHVVDENEINGPVQPQGRKLTM